MSTEVCSFIHLMSLFKSYRLNKHQIVKVTCVFFLNNLYLYCLAELVILVVTKCKTSLSIHFFLTLRSYIYLSVIF